MYRLFNKIVRLLIAFLFLSLYTNPTGASLLPQSLDSRFVKLQLPLGVSIEVPKNWRLLDGDINASIETAGEAAIKLSGIDLPRGKKVNLFRANSMPPTTYAGIAINATDSDINPNELRRASEQEVKELSTLLNQMMKKTLAVQNLQLLEFYGVRREYVSGHPALVIEYKRSGLQGPVIVQMTRLFLGEKEISLNLSYRESETALWKLIVLYIRKSLTVTQAALINARASKSVIVIDRFQLVINGLKIPRSSTKDSLVASLGKPSRVTRLQYGIVYSHDDLGITYRTDIDKDKVSDLTLYLRDIPEKWEFAPSKPFSGSLKINGRFLPNNNSLITDVRRLFPELKEDKQSFGNFYDIPLGERKLSFYVNSQTSEIKTITVSPL